MRTLILAAVSSFALVACGAQGSDEDQDTDSVASAESGDDVGYETYGTDNHADTMASNDDASGDQAQTTDIPDPEERPIMQAQVVLDRVGFGPGVIDGKMGMSTENALRGFQEANDLTVTGKLDEATKGALSEWDRIPATRVVTIPAAWGETSYTDMPEDVAEKAKLERLGYTSLVERLAYEPQGLNPVQEDPEMETEPDPDTEILLKKFEHFLNETARAENAYTRSHSLPRLLYPSFEDIHQGFVHEFISADGFGVTRISARYLPATPENIEIPETVPIPIPKPQPKSAPIASSDLVDDAQQAVETEQNSTVQELEMSIFHIQEMADFINQRGFGIVGNTSYVSKSPKYLDLATGFQAHAFRRMPDPPTNADKSVTWLIEKLELFLKQGFVLRNGAVRQRL